MTRVTNFGRKRTYVEAGFDNVNHQATDLPNNEEKINDNSKLEGYGNTDGTVIPPKKKRKRTKMSKRDGNAAAKAASDDNVAERDTITSLDLVEKDINLTPSKLSKSAKKKRREKEERKKASESRRQKRINEKLAATTCFACREKGHTAKDCPTTKDMTNEDGNKTSLKGVVGICYRCGSKQHTLSRCKKPINDADPLPFALCFVCNERGHIVSSCPKNKEKGVYPNGGCCKLCGDTSHLARDCGMRKQDITSNLIVLGTGNEAGADEDDFHTFKRRNTEVDHEEKQEEKMKRRLGVKTGTYSGITKSYGTISKPSKKKVVYF